ncbi:unnamed protein product [Trifolium pratense]|uniref:Uncharacterized protein n=1 Tax=Trifolium pratense TaxID=57577 RepID=A0ACB0L3I1_TRIPR|nr:unnamed protein product [Trifolium pratense]
MMKEWLAMFSLSILIYKYARSRCKRFKMESSARSRTQIVCYTLIAAATKSFLSGREDTIGDVHEVATIIRIGVEWQVPIGCLLIFDKKSGVFLIFGDDRMLAVAHGRGVYCDDEGVAYGDGLCGAYVAFNDFRLQIFVHLQILILTFLQAKLLMVKRVLQKNMMTFG